MRVRRLITFPSACLVAVAATFAMLAPSAFAATTIGSSCTATNLGPDIIFNQSHAVTSDGVITSWGSTVAPAVSITDPMSLRLKVVHLVSGGTWKVVGESGFSLLAHGTNTFNSQIPVKAGDVIGSWAANGSGSGSPYCSTSAQDFYYDNGGTDLPVGSTYTPSLAPGNEDAIWAVVEPDVDGDGFGDESQDHCPSNPASQNAAACPPPPISTYLGRTSKALTIYASARLAVPMQATGTVKIPKQKSITLSSTATTIAPFGITPLKLSYSKVLRKAIAAAPKNKPLKMSVTILGGTPLVTVKAVSVKLTPIKK